MKLFQEFYEDYETGQPVASKDISAVSPFVYICDGFYQWTCGHCKKDNSGRTEALSINGRVIRCDHCNYRSLLLRTDCDNVNDLNRRAKLLGENIAVQEQWLKKLEENATFIRDAQNKLLEETKIS